MRLHITTLAPLLALLPSFTIAQTVDGLIVPFSQLPLCATDCGPLYDAQGACVPPVTSSPDQACFCADARVAAFGVDGRGVCDTACVADSGGLGAISNWFREFCGITSGTPITPNPNPQDPNANPLQLPAETTLADGTVATTTPAPVVEEPQERKKKETWIEGHYQYIIMIVILVVAIVVIWIGACWWRKRYLRKRELGFELRPPHQPWVGTSDNTSPYGGNGGGGFDPKEGMIGSAVPVKSKKKWIVHTRT